MNEVVQNLLQHFPDGRQRGDSYQVRCPTHDDNQASLSIGPAKNGGAVIHCHAGCDPKAIMAHIGRPMSDLMPPKEEPKKSDRADWLKVQGTDKETEYIYTDAAGKWLSRALRIEWTEKNRQTGETRQKKTFKQQRRPREGESRGWQWGIEGVPRVLYRLPEVMAAVSSGVTVWIAEGEKDCDNLAALGLVATTNAMGAGKWLPEYSPTLAGASVVILPDNDKTGYDHANEVAALLQVVGATVKVVALPGLPVKGDVSDWLAKGGTAEQLQALADAESVWVPPVPVPVLSDTLPVVITTNRLDRDVAAECWQHIHDSNNPPQLFSRGEGMAYIGIDSDSKRVRVAMVNEDEMLFRLRRTVDTRSVRQTNNGPKQTHISPPRHIARDMLLDTAEKSRLPSLRGVVYAPVVGPMGDIVTTPGYHPLSRLYLATEGLPDAPCCCTCDDALAAYDRLMGEHGVFNEFPYDTQSDRSNAFALLITSFLRPYIRGNAPMALIEAPEQGTGKTLLAENMIAVSYPSPPRWTAPTGRRGDDATAEWQKVIVTANQDAPPFNFFDNVRGAISSPDLEALLTTPNAWNGRLLGGNENLTIYPENLTIVATGNNAEMNRDMSRRSYVIRLNAEMARPETRTGFLITNLNEYVQMNRGSLIKDVLTILSAWIAAGRPEGKAVKGSFERWARVISGILDFLGVPGFLENEATAQLLDSETAQWQAFTEIWYERHGSVSLTAKDLENEAINAEIIADNSHKDRIRLGNMLKQRRDRVFGRFQICMQADSHKKINTYSLRRLDTQIITKEYSETAGSAGTCGDLSERTRDPLDNEEGEDIQIQRGIGGSGRDSPHLPALPATSTAPPEVTQEMVRTANRAARDGTMPDSATSPIRLRIDATATPRTTLLHLLERGKQLRDLHGADWPETADGAIVYADGLILAQWWHLQSNMQQKGQ